MSITADPLSRKTDSSNQLTRLGTDAPGASSQTANPVCTAPGTLSSTMDQREKPPETAVNAASDARRTT
ncbi:hypothetical protein Psuf_022730 [Phytohabitans suffuscus]|uniref:Uncharacterized protein n=1 Tax=Phytohabitans suffuscus TaxID=624315 RepID=A0A6F8YFW5_9ACTN|nr:hypothetical protein Psuf_022730 [Phytohabitans suffuscus]